MKRALLIGAALAALAAASCGKKAVRPPPPVTEGPSLEKTFGEIRFTGAATQLISYKDIRLLVDPSFTSASLPALDYLLLTDAEPAHFSAGARAQLRKDLKTLASPTAAPVAREAGFSQVKALSPGQRLLLKKGENFLFVTAVGGESGRAVSGYLVEFDNGRNVLITGDRWNADPLREFVYSLRDDGKEIHVLILYSGSRGATENVLAQIIGLIQPQTAIVTPSVAGATPADEAVLRNALTGQMYGGSLRLAPTGDTFAF